MAGGRDHPNIFVANREAQRNVKRNLPPHLMRDEIKCICIHLLSSLCSRGDGDWIATSKCLSTLQRVLRFNLRRRPSFYVVPHGGHRSAPRVIAALTSLVHDAQSAADHENNRYKDGQ